MLKLIIFDCDGVLVDTEKITGSYFCRYLERCGLTINREDTISKYQGRDLKSVVTDIEAQTGVKVPDDFVDQFREETMADYKTNLLPISGIKNALDQIPISKCVASNGPAKKMELTLGVTGLSEYFTNAIFSAYDINKWKPDPGLFLHAATKMKASPNECLVVEDSIHGAKAGISAGMKVLGFATEKNANDFKVSGVDVFFNMDQLPELINKLSEQMK